MGPTIQPGGVETHFVDGRWKKNMNVVQLWNDTEREKSNLLVGTPSQVPLCPPWIPQGLVRIHGVTSYKIEIFNFPFILWLYCERLRPLHTRINSFRWTASKLGSVRCCASDPEAVQLSLRMCWKSQQGLLWRWIMPHLTNHAEQISNNIYTQLT
jgi:hypothetical protein